MFTFAISSSLSTAQDVENIAALPVEAAQAEEMLRDGANLLQVRAERTAAAAGGRAVLCCSRGQLAEQSFLLLLHVCVLLSLYPPCPCHASPPS